MYKKTKQKKNNLLHFSANFRSLKCCSFNVCVLLIQYRSHTIMYQSYYFYYKLILLFTRLQVIQILQVRVCKTGTLECSKMCMNGSE